MAVLLSHKEPLGKASDFFTTILPKREQAFSPKTKKMIAFAYQAALLRRVFLYRDGPRWGSFLRSSSKALARPFGSRMLWELDRRATRPCKPPHKYLCFTFRRPAPAGVSRLCEAAMPKPAPGQGTTPPTPHIPVLSHPVQSQFIPFVQGPGECVGAPGAFFPAKWHLLLWARVVKRWLCRCDARVVKQQKTTHPGRVG